MFVNWPKTIETYHEKPVQGEFGFHDSWRVHDNRKDEVLAWFEHLKVFNTDWH